jgi:hypothetical protein
VRIADALRAAPRARSAHAHANAAQARSGAAADRRRPAARRPDPRPARAAAPRPRHLRVALTRNLAHLRRRLADPRLPDTERQALEGAVAALGASLVALRALRTRMAAVLLG